MPECRVIMMYTTMPTTSFCSINMDMRHIKGCCAACLSLRQILLQETDFNSFSFHFSKRAMLLSSRAVRQLKVVILSENRAYILMDRR